MTVLMSATVTIHYSIISARQPGGSLGNKKGGQSRLFKGWFLVESSDLPGTISFLADSTEACLGAPPGRDTLLKFAAFAATLIPDVGHGDRSMAATVAPVDGIADVGCGGAYLGLFVHALLVFVQVVDDGQRQYRESDPLQGIVVAVIETEAGIEMAVAAMNVNAVVIALTRHMPVAVAFYMTRLLNME